MKLHEHNIPKKQEEQKFLKTVDACRTESKEDDFYFDPERDITLGEYQEIIKHTTNYLEQDRKYFHGYIENIENLLIVSPKHAKELHLDRLADSIKKAFSKKRDASSFRDYLTIFRHWSPPDLRTVIFCFPQLRDILFSELLRKGIGEAEFNMLREQQQWGTYLRQFVNVFFLYAHNPAWYQLKDEEKNSLKEYLRDEQNNSDDLADTGHTITDALLIFPSLRQEIQVLPKTYRALFKEFEKFRKERDWDLVLFYARCLTILSAESAEIDQNGQIKITPKPKPLKTIEPLPQRPV